MPLDAKYLDRYLTSEDRFSGSGPVIKYGPHVGRIASKAPEVTEVDGIMLSALRKKDGLRVKVKGGE